MSNFEMCSEFDESILQNVLKKEKYEWINSYDIKIKMFFKYGKYDKEGNLKTPALQKNGTAIPAQIKIVSAFNRMTDNVDVKIILNKEYWDELSTKEREGVIDNMLNYLEVKKDKLDEPISISDDSDKVQLKLKKPDFYCEGFLSLIEDYGKNYIPYQEANSIAKLVKEENNIKNTKTKSKKSSVYEEPDFDSATQAEDEYDRMYNQSELNLDEIELE